jgi:ABC-type multidrug transport system fused ATPase/permease subunit
MEPTIFKFVLRYSLRQQVVLLVLTGISFPFLYGSLQLPKTIVNDAIGSENFPKTYWGFEFSQVQYLMILCSLFLVLIGIRFGLRYYVNVYKGQLGERMLRRLRYLLYSQLLRFPLPHFRRTSQGELIAMITAEVEPLGGFIGDAFALPAFEGGTLLTILVFMFIQDPILGIAAISLYPLQMYLIPKLQRQVNLLAKERVKTVRKLSERIGESVSGIEEIHANDTSELERAEFVRWIGTIYEIRYVIYRKKFFIKFLNNVIGQATPFFFLSIGGYLVIAGELTFGALVAVLAAYKDLSAPWKELLSWYQMKEDTRVKYDQLMEQFQLAGMLEPALQEVPTEPVPPLRGPVIASNLTLQDDGGVKTVDGVGFQFSIGEKVALVGGTGSGVEGVAKLLARLLVPTAGHIAIDDVNLVMLPEAVTGRRIGYVGPSVPLFSGTLRDNLLYGLKHQPLGSVDYQDEALAERERSVREAKESGNTESDLAANWVDYQAVGVDSPDRLTDRVAEVLGQVGLEQDVFTFGLQGTIDPQAFPAIAEQILKARVVLHERLQDQKYKGLVEPFDRERYNANMSVAENLLFGTPIGPLFDLEHIAENPYMLSVLDKVGLTEEFLSTGLQVAKIMTEMFQDLRPGHEFFERFSFISAEALPEYQAMIRRVESVGLDKAETADRTLLLSLPFKLVPERHRLGLIDATVEQRLLEARGAFAEGLPDELRPSVAFFDQESYNAAASVQDNILFGKLAYGRQQSQRQIGALIAEVVDSLGLRQTLIEVGLGFSVGISGGRLSASQRQRVAIARSLLKRPDLLIIDHATAALDPASQSAIMKMLLGDSTGMGLVWVLNDIEEASGFDRAIVMEGGKIVEQGPVNELRQSVQFAHVAAD